MDNVNCILFKWFIISTHLGAAGNIIDNFIYINFYMLNVMLIKTFEWKNEMFKNIVSMIVLAVFLLSMASGVFAADNCVFQNGDMEEKQLTVNEEFNIKLESNPSTGYTWIPEFDSIFLKLVKSKYILPKNDNFIFGQPRTQKFTFKALKAGETDLTMVYVRPWENSIPAKEIIYHVKITG